MWQRFTESARRVILLAQEEAAKMNSGHVGTEHLLLGIARQNDTVAGQVLQRMNISPLRLRQEVEAEVPIGTAEQVGADEPKLTPKAKQVLELAADEARRMRHSYIGTEHVLLGLARERDGLAATILRRLGLTLDLVRQHVIAVLGQNVRDEAAAPAPQPVAPDTPESRDLELLLEVSVNIARSRQADSWSFTDLVQAALSPLGWHSARIMAQVNQELADLQAQKAAAVRSEDYEQAIKLRDRVREHEATLRQERTRRGVEFLQSREAAAEASEMRAAEFVVQLLLATAAEAERTGHAHASLVHLLLALLADATNEAAALLAGCGVDIEAVHTRLIDRLNTEGDTPQNEPASGAKDETTHGESVSAN